MYCAAPDVIGAKKAMDTNEIENREENPVLAEIDRIMEFNALMEKPEITKEDLEMEPEKRKHFAEWANNFLAQHTEEQQSAYLDKLEPAANEETQSSIWDRNHNLIMDYIKDYSEKFNRIPTKTEIAERLGLSRKTITRHLSDYEVNRRCKERQEAESFMLDAVKERVLSSALNGDLRAARLYYDINRNNHEGAGQGKGHTYINNQHNYLQLNGITLTQELIASLSPVQLAKIEEVLKGG